MKLLKVILVALVIWPIVSFAGPPQVKPVRLKPDLVIENLDVKVLKRIPKEGTRVRVYFTVENRGASTWSSLTKEGKKMCADGCFPIILNVLRDYPKGKYTKLCEVKCKGLGIGEKKTFYCDDFIRAGTQSKYHVIADYLNWIEESKENNNDWTTLAK